MPPPDWNTKAGFDATYYGSPEFDGRPSGRLRVVVNYCRWLVKEHNNESAQYAAFYSTITTPTNSIVLVGSGFAWSLEVLVDDYGYNPALLTGIDTSTYVQGAKGSTEEQDIRDAIIARGLDPDDPNHVHPVTGEVGRGKQLFDRCFTDTRPRATITVLDETLQNQGSVNRVLNAVGGSADFAISELMLSGLTDAEAQLVDSRMANLDVGQTWHMVVDRMPQAWIDKWDWNIHTLEEWSALMPNSNIVSALDFRAVGPDVP